MLARLYKSLIHLFTPHPANNHRPRLLEPSLLSALAIFILVANSSVKIFAQVRGGILGYASDITVEQVLDLTNRRRLDAGLPVLNLDNRLADAARRKAADMFAFNYWAHVNPQNNRQPWYFFDAVNYQYRFAGENLARDFGTTVPLVQAWIDSPTHRENLLSSRYRDTGIAVVNGILQGIDTTLVVQLFGTLQNPAAVPQVSAASNDQNTQNTQNTQIAGKSEIQQVGNSDNPALRQSNLSGSPSFPIFSPLDISKSIALSTLILIAAVILIDSFLVWRRRTHRLAGRNWAHLLFVTGIIILIAGLQKGLIK
jgi:hypothetical protein